MQTLQQRISKLWAAAFNLEAAVIASLPHLPPDERAKLETELRKFRKIVELIRK